MKKVFIKTLSLEHWRAQNRTIDFSHDTYIKADNRQGKSIASKAHISKF